MKRYFLILIISLTGFGCIKAQTSYFAFPDSNAQWYTYTYFTALGSFYEGHNVFSLDGDTIINNLNYHKLNSYGFIRSDSLKRTYFRYQTNFSSDTLEHCIFDFSLISGDTLADTIFPQPSSPFIYHTIIDSVGEVFIENSYRKKYFVRAGYGSLINSFWIEGIGSSKGPVSPFLGPTQGGGWSASLCKFVQEDSALYQNPAYAPCRYFLDTQTIPIPLNISIYPNPAMNELRINSNNHQVDEFLLYNVDGTLLIQLASLTNSYVDISYLPAGVYLAQITVQGTTQKFRWVKMAQRNY